MTRVRGRSATDVAHRSRVKRAAVGSLLVAATVSSVLGASGGETQRPAPPAAPTRLDVPHPRSSGRTISVLSGGDLQAAIDVAQPGDVISLEAGASFRGNFTLPKKSGSGWIVVRSSAEAGLPPPGTRISPAFAP